MQAAPFLSTIGAGIGAVSGFMRSRAENAMARRNADIMDDNAERSVMNAQVNAQETDFQLLGELDQLAADQAGSGLKTSSGSFQRVRAFNRQIAALNANRVVEDGRIEGQNYLNKAGELRAGAANNNPFLNLIVGGLNTAGSYVADADLVARRGARAAEIGR